ncbi:unnamed protein product [Heterobilharzia americana]|nr:unnamed protein product [Heterobilharzia americana]
MNTIEAVKITNIQSVKLNSSENRSEDLDKNRLNASWITNPELLSLYSIHSDFNDNITVNNSYLDPNVSNHHVQLINRTVIYNTTVNLSNKTSLQLSDNNIYLSAQNNKTFREIDNTMNSVQHRVLNSSDIILGYDTFEVSNCKRSISILWNKLGLEYPLTIGRTRFIPDERFQVQYKPPNRWHLIITNAQLNDTGVYSCTTGAGLNTNHTDIKDQSDLRHREYSSDSRAGKYLTQMKAADDTAKRRNKGREYYVSVVEPLPSERYQVDIPSSRTVIKNKTITVTGPNLVFYGTPLELICRVSFPSSEAKLDPAISLEWYHRGIRRLSNPYKSGGVYITMRWLDSHLLESRLFVAWASEAEAGQWICLERSNPIININSTQLSTYEKSKNQPSSAYTFSYLNSSVTYKPSNVDYVYDKIYIEIIDLPDTTQSSQLTLVSTTLNVPTISSSSPSPTVSSTSFDSPKSTLNRKFIRPGTLRESRRMNIKDEQLTLVERLIRSMSDCTRLRVDREITFIFFLLNCYFYTYMLHHIL